jgi:hypothetical protein
VCSLKSLKNPVGLRIFGKCWIEVMEFSTLFENYRAKNCIYLTFPNGNTGFRLNDAVITGLCRTYNIRSVGCQTRTIYTTKYEDCFDCYDTYLTWGPAWHFAFPQRMQFVKKVVNIGCIYLDTLLPRYKQEKHINSTSCKQKDLMVSIFPSDIGDKHHYTGGYTIRFLISCARMAAKHSNMHFIVKMKDPALIDFVMMNPEFTCVFDSVKENFELPKLFRYDYTELIRLSHIVIAIGFTTPGAEALLLGKRAIYYSELTCGGQAFRHIPDLVATNQEEFENHFERALNDYQTYCSINRASIDPLDPFRDGRALQRIIASLNL